MKKSWLIILWTLAVLIDIGVYIVIGIMMMADDDRYYGPLDKYGDTSPMSGFDKAITYLLWTWSFVNIAVTTILILQFIKKRRLALNPA
ncbi:hypothetical protein D0C36_04450 [Mucilaginibacter conchicola]|uniref:Uncharacterized protein n=1 Tax=Mucilaginibacter conchicola TaxID=2303333 RepID=A0A372NXN0_9SPHI|nr:hypothetical protein [Mucilaginibacter conchicola]RFZ94792.1 hypothetical protein D0C36_04450 [Mucilaginibacter conchicola]